MRPRSCRPINCRPCLPLSASSEERHRPSPIASGSADVADQGVHPPADPPTPPLRNAAPSIRPSGEHRPANQRLPGRLSLAQPRAHHASGDRSVILRIVESRLAAREPQLRSRQHKVLSCLHENIISRNAQLLMSLRLVFVQEMAQDQHGNGVRRFPPTEQSIPRRLWTDSGSRWQQLVAALCYVARLGVALSMSYLHFTASHGQRFGSQGSAPAGLDLKTLAPGPHAPTPAANMTVPGML